MGALIEAGKVSAVIIKDLFRFGREHVETSRYLEIIYPTLGVKFVAIQERVDTETGEDTEMMPFHNIFNEWYAAQTSKKVRAVWAMKAANGTKPLNLLYNISDTKHPNHDSLAAIKEKILSKRSLIFSFTAQ